MTGQCPGVPGCPGSVPGHCSGECPGVPPPIGGHQGHTAAGDLEHDPAGTPLLELALPVVEADGTLHVLVSETGRLDPVEDDP
jgi:hypothetical protein